MLTEVIERLFRGSQQVPKSSTAELRELFPQITPEIAKKSLEGVLYQDMDTFEKRVSLDSIDSLIDFTQLGKVAPPWLSPVSYITETLKPNSAKFWQKAIESSVEPNGCYSGASLAYSNLTFYASSMVAINLTAALGPDFQRIQRQDAIPYVREKIYGIASYLNLLFSGPIQNCDDVLERLKQFYCPNPTGSLALRSVGLSKAFESKSGQCPAIKLTATLFNCYGDLLTDSEYQEYLKSRITLPAKASQYFY
jgi:hypothetical protein